MAEHVEQLAFKTSEPPFIWLGRRGCGSGHKVFDPVPRPPTAFPVLLAGGGSGGHVFPLLAVADELRRLYAATSVSFVGTPRGLETELLGRRGESLRLLDVEPIKGRDVRGTWRGLVKAARVWPAARALLRELRPRAVLSAGGYAGGPIALAACSLGIPLALLEPNAVAGLTTRVLCPFAARAYVAFPELPGRFRRGAVRAYGLPLRKGFATPDAVKGYEPVVGRARVVVLGGSQGAAALNEALPAALALVRHQVPELSVVHQAGQDRDVAVRAAYHRHGFGEHADVHSFLEDMPARLASADVVVSRAGAGAIAEICALGRAAIYVPYPFAADRHQDKNAMILETAGAARRVSAAEATPERLAAELTTLLTSPAARAALALAARRRGNPVAAAQVAADFLQLAGAPFSSPESLKETHVSRTGAADSFCRSGRHRHERPSGNSP